MQDARPLYLRAVAGYGDDRVARMTKPLDPEIKAHRAILRALRGLPLADQQRILRYWRDRGGYLQPDPPVDPAPSSEKVT